MKITKNALLFTATLVLVVFSGCSTPEQTRAISPQQISLQQSDRGISTIHSPSISAANSAIEPIAPKIAQSSFENGENFNCEAPRTQLEMNFCAANQAREADEKLNKVYAKLREKVQGTSQETRLIAAQTAWIDFRDADCEYSQRRYDGGSIMPAIYALCVVDLTEKRTRQLEDYLEQG